MAAGERLQVIVPTAVAKAIKKDARQLGTSVSSVVSAILINKYKKAVKR